MTLDSRDRGYLLLLLVLAFCFVPVWLFHGWDVAIVPLSALAFDMLARMMTSRLHLSAETIFSTLGQAVVFTGSASLLAHLIGHLRHTGFRLACLVFFVAGLIGVPFLPLLFPPMGIIFSCLGWLGIFTVVALLLSRFTRSLRHPATRMACRAAVAAALVATSFLPVITHRKGAPGGGWGGGTYTFWSAIPRFFEKYFDAS